MTFDSNRCELNFQGTAWAGVVTVVGFSAVNIHKKDFLVSGNETEQCKTAYGQVCASLCVLCKLLIPVHDSRMYVLLFSINDFYIACSFSTYYNLVMPNSNAVVIWSCA